jgi:hypothetical protein
MAPRACHHHAFQMALCRPTVQAGTAAFSALPTGHSPQTENVKNFVFASLQNRPSILSLLGRKAVRNRCLIIQLATCFSFVNMSSIVCKRVIGIGEAFEEVKEPPSSTLPLSSTSHSVFTSTTSLRPTPGRPVDSARNSKSTSTVVGSHRWRQTACHVPQLPASTSQHPCMQSLHLRVIR